MDMKERDRFYWSRPDRKDIPSEGCMILLKNQNGIVLATDSRLTKSGKYRDDFQKVFMIPEKDIMFGVVGYYGHDEELLKTIQESLRTMEYDDAIVRIKRLAHCLAIPQRTNVFICHHKQVFIIDLVSDAVSHVQIPDRFVGIISAGSHSFMQDCFSFKELLDCSLESLKEKAFDIIQNECIIDRFIHSKNPNFVETIGGDIMVISRTKEGLIEEDLYQNS